MNAREVPSSTATATDRSIRPFIAPIIVFGVLTALEGYLPLSLYPIAYVVKAIAVTWALLHWREPLKDIRPSAGVLLPSAVVGLVVLVLWIGVDRVVPYPHFGQRVGFDPWTIGNPAAAWAFIAVRLYGLVLMVPVMEELFWRSFLLRYLVDPEVVTVPIGTFTATSLAVVVGASAVAHPEWLVAALANLVYCLWLGRTRSLFSTVIAHAVTNGALGWYVLVTREWQYW